MVNTSFMMGGAVGLASLASLADARTTALRSSGSAPLAALTSGYHVAFVVAAAFAAAAAVLAAIAFRGTTAAHLPDPTVRESASR